MPAGVSVIVQSGAAHITPDPDKRGQVIAALTAITTLIQVDTSGPRKSYITTEEAARNAGLVDDPKPVAKKAPAKKAAAPKVPATTSDAEA